MAGLDAGSAAIWQQKTSGHCGIMLKSPLGQSGQSPEADACTVAKGTICAAMA